VAHRQRRAVRRGVEPDSSANRLHAARNAVLSLRAHAIEFRPVATEDELLLADVRAASRGDGEAYARIIRRYQRPLASRMQRFARDARAVEELVHDVFVEAYFSLPTYRADAPLEHWLQRIATRVGYRYWTRRRRAAAPLRGDLAVASASHEESIDLAEEAATLLEQLPPRDRLVLTLLYVESRSVAEAAHLAGWSQTMVKVQAHRARKKLRKLIEKSRGEPLDWTS
jgi:RNA polymerase sigma-70 factor (ECF subfamily)